MSRRPRRPEPNSIDPDGEFPLGAPEYFFYLLFQAQRQRDVALDRPLAPAELNLAQWRTLAIIRRIEDCTMTLLARYSTIERTTLTRSVDQLVARGLVDRWTPDRDRRQANLALTDLGEQVYGQAVEIMLGHNARVLEGGDAERLRETTRMLQDTLTRLVDDPALGEDLVTFGHRLPVR